ncbi:hypothetical protein A4X06_0g1145 [Tilletia controversa]|uniref:Uncharacterized protein n=1 Tax=Tilletia controversa TaxID=13291 RepID=A0A8X7MY10_9BASI|nr:hypothetical protein A4X06_0g1145 [Tilletia controversa]
MLIPSTKEDKAYLAHKNRINSDSAATSEAKNMACPVNSPAFHALIFLIGLLIVLGRYVKGAEVSNLSSPAGALPLLIAVARSPALGL